jgi:hypothetical protein
MVPPNLGRAFFANSSKSVDALVVDLSLGGIGLIMETYIEPGTLLRIELGNGDKVTYVELLANVIQTKQLDFSKWRCGCEWLHQMTEEELLILR